MRISVFIFITLLFKSTYLKNAEATNYWVIWNIGQGQWVTHVKADQCFHYDVGGETATIQKISQKILVACGERLNLLSLSHWDLDHYSNITQLAKVVSNICWLAQPKISSQKKSAVKILDLRLPDCSYPVLTSALGQIQIWRPRVFKTTNDSSSVIVDQDFLIPGDSTIFEEKMWLFEIKELTDVKVLILGHHGSRTSTHQNLLTRLTNLQMTVASARYLKYRHPHIETIQRIKKRKVALLKTEDWGNIFIQN